MNQVYFYFASAQDRKASHFLRLNPFMNQVYFYAENMIRLLGSPETTGLNPFMNQVYFYGKSLLITTTKPRSLNPFMNQVYFYGSTTPFDHRPHP